ncbi:MAG: hypothetical protein Q9165_000024 [Trypethelium subeluteriae]
MADGVDYARLREQTMGAGGEEEAVTVNTRALIDKVLARYSGEWTTLRELIQNAADAQATKVIIKFDTLPSRNIPVPQTTEPSLLLKHTLLNHTLQRLTVRNDGEAFASTDWARLKRIAEGNPDETKIGAFGVGFYSVFSECETPFVSSGQQTMAFYWKGNSLFTRMGKVPSQQVSPETAFVLDYRNQSSPLPNLMSICQFLSTSLTFVGLERIELYLDQRRLLVLTKKTAPGANVHLPREVNPKTQEGLMKIVGVEHQSAQIDAKWLNIVGWSPVKSTGLSQTDNASDAAAPSLRSFFSRLNVSSSTASTAKKQAAREEEATQRAIAEDLAGECQATVFLRISTVNIQSYVPKALAQELERATKKPPPKHTRIAILTSPHDETVASMSTMGSSGTKKAGEIFASVLPTRNGRIFIGFPTAQTTGLLAHISAPSVIPTVERESIDLNARHVRTWNIEMLRVAGIACRIAYAGELADLKAKLEQRHVDLARSKGGIEKAEIADLLPTAIHTLKQYTCQESTPSSKVGEIIEEAFWTCNTNATVDILSTRGVLPSHRVRIATEDLSFVDGIPVIPQALAEGAKGFIAKLRDFGLLTEITHTDIRNELEERPLNEAQLVEFLKWAGTKISTGQLDPPSIKPLMSVVVALLNDTQGSSSKGNVLPLGEIVTFQIPSKIPTELPIPHDTIPLRFSKGLARSTLEAFGWEELQVVPWLKFIVMNAEANGPEQNITTSASFAAQILPVLSKAWDTLSQSSKETVVGLLRSRTVVPTKQGLRKPPESYFASVKLFDDLPTVHGLHSTKEKFLLALGVRKTIELNVVFDRLMARSSSDKSTQGKWSHVDLVKYLVSVRDDIPKQDIDRLRNAAICPAEGSNEQPPPDRLFKLSDLFEPKNDLRALDLPILQWPGLYHSSTAEGKFMSFLGLKPYPSVPELIDIMVKAAKRGDVKRYEHALNYFIINHSSNNYFKINLSSIEIPFLPLSDGKLSKLVSPSSCFTNTRAALLGYSILRQDLHPHGQKLGVASDPHINDAARQVAQAPPQTRAEARDVFGYMAGRLNEIQGTLAGQLGECAIVPITKAPKNDSTKQNPSTLRHVTPKSVFLGDGVTYGDIFDFVDLGPEANAFLLKVGSKQEPTSVEIAALVVREPARLLSVFDSHERYLEMLRRLADNVSTLKADKQLWKDLRRSPCLLSYKQVPRAKKTGKGVDDESDDDYDDPEDEESIREFGLASASEIVIVDEILIYRHFYDKLRAAPQEDVIERFYSALGTPYLSSLVENYLRTGIRSRDQDSAVRLCSLILERTRLLLHEQSSEVVLHTSRWLEKNLSVEAVQSLSVERSLRGYNLKVSMRKTAALEKESRRGWVLHVTPKHDLFDVSRELLPLILRKPRQNDYMALEMILTTDLRKLKAKGFNTDRILRQKAIEARIAEEERQKQIDQEQQRLREQEQAWTEEHSEKGNGRSRKSMNPADAMPGAFSPETPDGHPPSAPTPLPPARNKGFFSNLTRTLGLDDDRTSKQLQNIFGSQPNATASEDQTSREPEDTPPPYTQNDISRSKPIKAIKSSTGNPETVTAPHATYQNLLNAIDASRSHDSTSVFSSPATNIIKEQASYCDTAPGQDISYYGSSAPGIKIFMSNAIADKSGFAAANVEGLNAFAVLLLDCGSIFGIRPGGLHVFYDEKGGTIAFNRQGSLFCNYRFFGQLHWRSWVEGRTEGKREALVYWWVVLCHELAHNLVESHSADHSYYTESFVMQYFSKMVSKMVAKFVQNPSDVSIRKHSSSIIRPRKHVTALEDLGSMRLLSKKFNQVVAALFFQDISLDFSCGRVADPSLQDEAHKIRRFRMLSSSSNAAYVRRLVIGHCRGSQHELQETHPGDKLVWYTDALACDLPARLGLFSNLRNLHFAVVAFQGKLVAQFARALSLNPFPSLAILSVTLAHHEDFATFVYGSECEATNLQSTLGQLRDLRIKLVNPWRTSEITTLSYTAFFHTIQMTRHLTKLKIDAASDPEFIELGQLDITHLNQLKHLLIQHIFSPGQHLVRLLKQNSTTLKSLSLRHVELSSDSWDRVFEGTLGVEFLTYFKCWANGYAKHNGQYFVPEELMDLMGNSLDLWNMHWRDLVALGELQRRVNEIRVRQELGLWGIGEEFMRLNEASLEEWDMKSGSG